MVVYITYESTNSASRPIISATHMNPSSDVQASALHESQRLACRVLHISQQSKRSPSSGKWHLDADISSSYKPCRRTVAD